MSDERGCGPAGVGVGGQKALALRHTYLATLPKVPYGYLYLYLPSL
jgi:hypothetical protein